jgi:uncharacterized phage protein gp47/JayE
MKKRIKQICASFLAAIMVFTYMPVLGLSAVYANDDRIPATDSNLQQVTVHFESFSLPYTGEIPELSEVEELQTVKVVGTTQTDLELTIHEDYEVSTIAKKPTQ